MSRFQTQVLPIDVLSIKFAPGATLPQISDPATEKHLKEAAKVIANSDELVGFPTETVYGLGGLALNDRAVKNIFQAKNRPSDNPLIVHIASLDQLERLIRANTNAKSNAYPKIYEPLIKQHWPGPVSVLIPIDVDIQDKSDPYVLSRLVTNNLDTVAVRFPSDPVARALIALSDTPIAAPSANTSTKPSPTAAAHVFNDLQGKLPIILDGGDCSIGLESTVVNGLVDPPTMLRPGGLLVTKLRKIPGFENLVTEVSKKVLGPVRTPGMKYKHYSPSAKVILVVQKSGTVSEADLERLFNEHGSGKVGLASEGGSVGKKGAICRLLGEGVQQVQFNMFRTLREMDLEGVDTIFMIVKGATLNGEEGLALANRLGKASSEKVEV